MIALLLVGGFLWGVGWLVGVVLLWLSDAWTIRQKLIGTFVVPGGLALPLYLLIVATLATSSGGPAAWERGLIVAGLVAVAVAAVAAAVFLARRARPRPALTVSA